ncbi:putative defensin-like protein 27 [Arabidopsis lyrata subsp. lyrata]|uniref:putative defensin-like protein 27 n=1 Tax=Arabidopsis lyrata subsp. lyrata TaxID=81972 RepID=UPI000A29C15B|nr:putative defensin-like protein 27 [Arabidopsis lyrata subsp. lyrata]|eukprot:XP_020877533.1 putative defensin-like protein 27 [Arabidopsis lyrata subsp. lyrata]
MAYRRFVFFAFIALSVLLACVESISMVREDSILPPNKRASLCCKDHPEFGVCTSNTKCNKRCLRGCKNRKGGFCKRKVCHCYC